MNTQKQESFCQVCFVSTIIPLPYNSLISCIICKQSVHRYCYLPSSEKAHKFKCDQCKEGFTGEKCIICGNGGFLKKVSKGDKDAWGHVVCLLFSGQFLVSRYETLQFVQIQSSKNRPNKSAKHQKCDICHISTPYVMQCSHSKCQSSSHLYCALSTFNYIQSKGYKCLLAMLPNKSTNQPYFLNNLTKFLKNQCGFTWLSKIVGKHKLKKPIVGVVCDLHQIKIVDCRCGELDFEAADWIYCDACTKWEHQRCSNLPKQALSSASAYICQACLTWRKLIHEDSLMPLPKLMPKMQIYDFVYFHVWLEEHNYQLSEEVRKTMWRMPTLPSLLYLPQWKKEVENKFHEEIDWGSFKKKISTIWIFNQNKNIKIKDKELIQAKQERQDRLSELFQNHKEKIEMIGFLSEKDHRYPQKSINLFPLTQNKLIQIIDVLQFFDSQQPCCSDLLKRIKFEISDEKDHDDSTSLVGKVVIHPLQEITEFIQSIRKIRKGGEKQMERCIQKMIGIFKSQKIKEAYNLLEEGSIAQSYLKPFMIYRSAEAIMQHLTIIIQLRFEPSRFSPALIGILPQVRKFLQDQIRYRLLQYGTKKFLKENSQKKTFNQRKEELTENKIIQWMKKCRFDTDSYQRAVTLRQYILSYQKANLMLDSYFCFYAKINTLLSVVSPFPYSSSVLNTPIQQFYSLKIQDSKGIDALFDFFEGIVEVQIQLFGEQMKTVLKSKAVALLEKISKRNQIFQNYRQYKITKYLSAKHSIDIPKISLLLSQAMAIESQLAFLPLDFSSPTAIASFQPVLSNAITTATQQSLNFILKKLKVIQRWAFLYKNILQIIDGQMILGIEGKNLKKLNKKPNHHQIKGLLDLAIKNQFPTCAFLDKLKSINTRCQPYKLLFDKYFNCLSLCYSSEIVDTPGKLQYEEFAKLLKQLTEEPFEFDIEAMEVEDSMKEWTTLKEQAQRKDLTVEQAEILMQKFSKNPFHYDQYYELVKLIEKPESYHHFESKYSIDSSEHSFYSSSISCQSLEDNLSESSPQNLADLLTKIESIPKQYYYEFVKKVRKGIKSNYRMSVADKDQMLMRIDKLLIPVEEILGKYDSVISKFKSGIEFIHSDILMVRSLMKVYDSMHLNHSTFLSLKINMLMYESITNESLASIKICPMIPSTLSPSFKIANERKQGQKCEMLKK